MANFQAPGRMSGRTYNFNIRGDLPSETERTRIAQYIAQQEDVFAQQYQDTMGQPLAAPESERGAIGRGFERGKSSAYSTLGSAVEYAGSGMGLESLRDFGAGMRQSGDTAGFLKDLSMPAETRWEDVNGIGSFGSYLGESLGQTAPITGGVIAGGLAAAGAVLLAPETAAAAGIGTGLASILGGTAVGTPFAFGSNVQRQEAEVKAGRRAAVDPGAALVAAVGQSALDAISDRITLIGSGLVKPAKNIFVRGLVGTAESAAAEGLTEVGQQIIERQQAGLSLTDDAAIKEYLDAGIAGGLIGGVVGGPLAAVGAHGRSDDIGENGPPAGTNQPPTTPPAPGEPGAVPTQAPPAPGKPSADASVTPEGAPAAAPPVITPADLKTLGIHHGSGLAKYVRNTPNPDPVKVKELLTSYIANPKNADKFSAITAFMDSIGQPAVQETPKETSTEIAPAVVPPADLTDEVAVPPSGTTGTAPTGTEGWKLHLNPVPGSEQAISDYLTEKGIPHKVGQNSDQVGKGMTVYIGAKDAANALANDLNSRFNDSLKDAEGEVLYDDTPLAGKVWGRFDIGKKDADFHQYGKEGIPFLAEDMGQLNYAKDRTGASDEARNRADAILKRRYGAFYTGTPVEQAVAETTAAKEITPAGTLEDTAKAWDTQNRTNRSDAWFEGNVTTNAAFKAVEKEGNFIPAHGMSKAPTLSQGLKQLTTMLDGGIDAKRTLNTAPLTAIPGSSSTTPGGYAYRDGPFIVTFRQGLAGQPTSADITGVLVNPANAEIAAQLQAKYPNLTIRTFDAVADVVAASKTKSEVQNGEVVNDEAIGAGPENAGLGEENVGAKPNTVEPAADAEKVIDTGLDTPADGTDGLGEPAGEQPAALDLGVALGIDPKTPLTDLTGRQVDAVSTALSETYGKNYTTSQLLQLQDELRARNVAVEEAANVAAQEKLTARITELSEQETVKSAENAAKARSYPKAVLDRIKVAYKKFFDDAQPTTAGREKLKDFTTSADKEKILTLLTKEKPSGVKGGSAYDYFSKFYRPIDALDLLAQHIADPNEKRARADNKTAEEVSAEKAEQKADVTGFKNAVNIAEDAYFKGLGGSSATKAEAWVRAEGNLDPTTVAAFDALITAKEKALAEAAKRRVQNAMYTAFFEADVNEQVSDENANEALVNTRTKAKAVIKAAKNLEVTDTSSAPTTLSQVVGAIRAAESKPVSLPKLPWHKRVLSTAMALEQSLANHVVNFLENNNLMAAMRGISETSSDPRLSILSMRLRNYVKDTQVRMVDDLSTSTGETAAAAYDPATDTILINRSSPYALTNVTVLHEVVHAITHKALNNPNLPITQQLTKLFAESQQALGTDTVGMNNIHEFVAEAFTNKSFRDVLQGLNPNGGKFSAWQRFKNAVANFARRIFGAQPKPLGSLMDNLDMHLDQLLDTSSDVTGVRPDPDQGILYRIAGDPKELTDIDAGFFRYESKFGQPTKSYRGDWARSAAAFFKNSAAMLARGVLGFLHLQPLADLAHELKIAGSYDLLKAVNELEAASKRSDDEVKGVLKVAEAWVKKFPQLKRTFDKVVAFSTIHQVDPEKTEAHYTKYWLKYDPTGKFETGVQYQSYDTAAARDAKLAELQGKYGEKNARRAGNANPKKAAQFKQMEESWKSLGPEGQALYRLMRAMYKKQFMAMKAAVGGKIDYALSSDAEIASALKSSVYERFFDFQSLEPYFPLARRGDFWIEYSALNPETKEYETVKESFETREERARVVSMLKQEVPSVALKPDGAPEVMLYENTGMEKGRIGAPETKFVRDVLNALAAGNVSKAAQEQITELFLNALPETNFARALKGRKGVRGFEPDALEAFRMKAFTLGRQAARYPYSSRIRELQENIQAAGMGTASDDQLRLAVIKELNSRAENALNPPQGAWQDAAKSMNQFAYIYTLAGNLSAALVNLSAVPIVMAPYLASRYGLSRTASVTGRAFKLFLNSGFDTNLTLPTDYMGKSTVNVRASPSMDNYYELQDVNGVQDYVVRKDLKLTAAERKELEEMQPLIKLAAEQGFLHRSLTYDTLGAESFGENRTLLQKMNALQGLPFHMVERSNRQVSMMVSYKLELDRMRKKPTQKEQSMTDDEKQKKAAEEALYMTAEMHGTHTLAAGSRYAQSGLGRIAMMFKGYGINIFYLQAKSIAQALGYMLPGDSAEAKAQRAVAFKQLMGLQLSTALIAGVSGVPLYGLYRMMYNAMHGDDEEDADMVTRKAFGELFFRGPINAIMGGDAASRMGLNDLLIRSNPYADTQSTADYVAALIGGPAWSTGNQVASGIGEMVKAATGGGGDFQRGLENTLPPVVKNVLKTWRYANEGAQTRRGDPVYGDISTGEIAWQIIGFKPAELAHREEVTRGVARIDKTLNKQRSTLMNRYNVARAQGDYKAASAVLQEIRDYNAKVRAKSPKLQILQDNLDASGKSFDKTTARTYNGVTLSPAMESYLKTMLRDHGVLSQ